MRGLGVDSVYWVCAYAKRHHRLDCDMSDPGHTSFRRAVSMSCGVLLILGKNPVPFSRMWCGYETWHALTDSLGSSCMLLDITSASSHSPQLLTDGFTAAEDHVRKTNTRVASKLKHLRERGFPLEVLKHGLSAKLKLAEASLEDKDPLQSRNFDLVSGKFHARLAMSAWAAAQSRRLVKQLGLPEALKKAHCSDLFLSLQAFQHPSDEDLADLIAGLPPLEHLHLDCSGCAAITLPALPVAFPKSLSQLRLNFRGCRRIGDAGVAAFLPASLERLQLDFQDCKDLSVAGLEALLSAFPTLQSSNLGLWGCVDLVDAGMAAVAAALPQSLQSLTLGFGWCEKLGDAGLAALAAGLPKSLQSFSLGFGWCDSFRDAGLAALALALPKSLQAFKPCTWASTGAATWEMEGSPPWLQPCPGLSKT